MSNLFGNLGNDPKMQRQALTSRYAAARTNLLLMIVFSLFNVLMLAANSGVYFLFSASIPYLLTDLGMMLCGMYPQEYYEGLEAMIFFDKSFFVALLVISLLILAVYLLCWIFSKKKCGFLIGALVLFSIDTVIMIISYGLSSIIDLAFHIWVIVILAMGISAHYKLRKLPEECGFVEGEFAELPSDGNEAIEEASAAKVKDSVALRPADLDVKTKVFLEYEAYGHKITYRRVKRTNELVIDGDVYAEYTALVEMPHLLTANVGGHSFAAGIDNTSHMTISVDGQIAKTKLRII